MLCYQRLRLLVFAIGAAGVSLVIPPPASATTLTAQINRERAAHNLPALRTLRVLHASSHSWARKMIRRHRFRHNMRTPVRRRFHRFGENVAITFGRGGPRTVVAMWMRSPTHRGLILSPSWRYIGSGTARGRFGGRMARTWVTRFAA